MSFTLVPQIVTDKTAMIWVGAIDEQVLRSDFRLEYADGVNPAVVETLEKSEWRAWKTRHVLDGSIKSSAEIRVIHYRRITLGLRQPLVPRTKYTVSLFRDDELLSGCEATVTTLPAELPNEDNPLKVLVGSCFYSPNDPHGLVGQTYMSIPREEKPEIKFLCGDQVYLDNPWRETTLDIIRPIMPPELMRTYFFNKYEANWTHKTGTKEDPGGFGALLSNGANYFCSDDHEFWNNAPDWGVVASVNTISTGQRRWWFREGRQLFRLFQSLAPWMTFDVPPLSFCIADTRINRLPHQEQFMEEEDLEAVGQWIQELKGPGVLVMGQVFLTEKTPFWNSFAELGLPDYERQYNKLKRFIQGSPHSIVFFTGDVHFGRMSYCDLNAQLGTKFVEVVSSPMKLVSGFWKNKQAFGSYEDAPDVFKNGTMKSIKIVDGKEHFATVAFSLTADKKVKMSVKGWQIMETPNDEKLKVFDIDKEIILV